MALPLLLLSLKIPVAPVSPALPVVSRVESAALIQALPTLPPGFKPLDDGLLGVKVTAPKGPAPLAPAAAAAAFSIGAKLFDGRVITTTRELEPALEPVPAR